MSEEIKKSQTDSVVEDTESVSSEPKESDASAQQDKKIKPKKVSAKEERIAALEAEVTRLNAMVEDYKDQHLRNQAELQNFKRRMTEEKIKDRQFANVDIMKKLLPVIDHLEAALENEGHKESFQPFLKGFQMIHKNLLEALTSEGLQVIEALEQPFDPSLHEAVMTEEHPSLPSQTVIQEFQKGYKFKDRLLRATMVKVSE